MRAAKQLADEYFQSLNRGLQLEATSEELAIYRAGPLNTPHLDFVVCLECGQKYASIATKHLQKHGLTWKTYQAKWPDAPMYCKSSHDARNRASLKFQKRYYAANFEELNRKRRTPAYQARAKQAARRRRAADRAEHSAYNREYGRKKTLRASEEELDRFLKTPDTCDYVVCLERDCRARLRDIGGTHIQKIHRLTIEQYEERHPGAPTKARIKLAEAKREQGPRRRGRRPSPLEQSEYFIVGMQVEIEIPEGLKENKDAIVRARRVVSEKTGRFVDTVAQYHKKYRQIMRTIGRSLPSRPV